MAVANTREIAVVSSRQVRKRARYRPDEPPGAVGMRRSTPYLFLLPGLFLFGFMFAWPAVIAIQLAFSDYDIVNPIEFIGLENFARMAEDPRFHRALLNSFLFLLMMLPLTAVIPLWLAVLVNQKLRGIGAFRVMYYLPVVTSMVAVAVAWRYVFDRQGVVNWLLSAGGLVDQPIQFLLEPQWALPAVAIIEGWKNMGLFMMIYLAGLQGIPLEITEASLVDGANAWQRMWHIITPMMLPWVAVTLTLGMLEAMKSFESIYILTRGGPQDATLTLGYYIWSTAFENYDMGYASAIGLVLWAIMIVLALLNQRITKSG